MKSFYELTVIDTQNLLEIQVELIEHDNPIYEFFINGIKMLSRDIIKIDLLDPLLLKCTINTGAIEVAKITINGKEILPIYQHLAEPKTNWITRMWEFSIPEPFYPWYHEITGQGWIA